MHNQFEAIRRALDEQLIQAELPSTPIHDKAPKLDKHGMQQEIKSKAQKLHEQIKEFNTVLHHPWLGGRIELGTDPETINWDAMPQEVAACFRPEFEYQPEDITAFTISGELEPAIGNTIKIDLERRGSVWSYVHVGAIVRKSYLGGTTYIFCKAKEAQPKAAREAMEQLDEKLWQHHLTQELEDKQLPFIVHEVNQLRLTKKVLDFAMNELETRVGVKKA